VSLSDTVPHVCHCTFDNKLAGPLLARTHAFGLMKSMNMMNRDMHAKVGPLSRAKVVGGLLAAAGAVAAAGAQPTLPSDADIARAAKQAPNLEDAVRRASERASGFRPPVPDAMPKAGATPIPDPAEVARRLSGGTHSAEPRVLIAVSLSLPPETLDHLAQQAARVGAHLVLRGVVGDSLTKTATATAPYIKKYPGVQFDIDPTIFRRFRIERVPTFVLTRDDQELRSCTKECDASDYYVSVAGDVSLDYALEHIGKRSKQPFTGRAEQLLTKLRESK
jgi:conjugal transfer pilus assembly protein TrbC